MTREGARAVRAGPGLALGLLTGVSAAVSGVKRDFAGTLTRHFPPVLVALRSRSRLRLEGRTRTLSGPSPDLSYARTLAPSAPCDPDPISLSCTVSLGIGQIMPAGEPEYRLSGSDRKFLTLAGRSARNGTRRLWSVADEFPATEGRADTRSRCRRSHRPGCRPLSFRHAASMSQNNNAPDPSVSGAGKEVRAVNVCATGSSFPRMTTYGRGGLSAFPPRTASNHVGYLACCELNADGEDRPGAHLGPPSDELC